MLGGGNYEEPIGISLTEINAVNEHGIAKGVPVSGDKPLIASSGDKAITIIKGEWIGITLIRSPFIYYSVQPRGKNACDDADEHACNSS